MEEEQLRVTKARDLLLKEDLDLEEYRQVKRSGEERFLELETQLEKIEPKPDNEFGKLFQKAFQFAGKLDFIFSSCDLSQKRRLTGSIFPENLTFDGEEHRTTRINEVLSFIYLINNELKSKKNGQNHSKMTLPRVVGPPGIEPGTY